MNSVREYLQELHDWEIEMLATSPTHREMTSKEISLDLNVSPDVVLEELNKLKKEPEDQSFKPFKPTYVPEEYLTRVRRMEFMNQVYTVLEATYDGLSKTQILRALKKDNISWRDTMTEVLDYMEGRGKIIRAGNKIYLTDRLMHRENTYHRIVYGIIHDEGPASKSYILSKMGYRNTRGYKKLEETLSLMAEEGFIINEKDKWKVNI